MEIYPTQENLFPAVYFFFCFSFDWQVINEHFAIINKHLERKEKSL